MADIPEYLSATVTDEDEYNVIMALFDDYEGTRDECIRMSLLREADRRGIDFDIDYEQQDEDTLEYNPSEFEGTLSSEQINEILKTDELINPAHVDQLPRDKQPKAEVVARCCAYSGRKPSRDTIRSILGVSSETARTYSDMVKYRFKDIVTSDKQGVQDGSDEGVGEGGEEEEMEGTTTEEELCGLYDGVRSADPASDDYIRVAARVATSGVEGCEDELTKLRDDYDRDAVASRVGSDIAEIISERLEYVSGVGGRVDDLMMDWVADALGDEYGGDGRNLALCRVGRIDDVDIEDDEDDGEEDEGYELADVPYEPVEQCQAVSSSSGHDRCPEEAEPGDDYCHNHLKILNDPKRDDPVDYVDDEV